MDTAQSAEFNFMKTRVVKPHEATDETQLELKIGDVVFVLEQDNSGWWGGHKEGEDNTGWFPGSCVAAIEEQADEAIKRDSGSCRSPAGSVRAENHMPSTCLEGLDIDSAADPLQHGGRMVASPNRSPNRRVSGGMPAAQAEDTALQQEYQNMVALNEEQRGELDRLRHQLHDTNQIALDAKWRQEESDRDCQAFKAERDALKKTVQELTNKVEAAEEKARHAKSELKNSRMETEDARAENLKLKRHLEEKEKALQRALEAAQQVQSGLGAAPQDVAAKPPAASPLGKGTASDETRRRLFPSTADHGLAGLPPTEKDLQPCMLDMTTEDVSNISATVETLPRFKSEASSFKPPPASGRSASHSGPRGLGMRSNSLTRPAFRPSNPATSSSMMLSPVGGLTKCHSTGDMPTPARLDGGEAPAVGTVRERRAMFEQIAQRTGTPSRTEGQRPATEGDLSLHAAPRSFSSQRSPATDKSLLARPESARELPRQQVARSEVPAPTAFPGLQILEQEEPVEGQVNFNMSPMKRHA